MAMKNPVHPGAILRQDCLAPLGLTVTEGARRLGVGRQALSALVNQRAAVSIDTPSSTVPVIGVLLLDQSRVIEYRAANSPAVGI